MQCVLKVQDDSDYAFFSVEADSFDHAKEIVWKHLPNARILSVEYFDEYKHCIYNTLAPLGFVVAKVVPDSDDKLFNVVDLADDALNKAVQRTLINLEQCRGPGKAVHLLVQAKSRRRAPDYCHDAQLMSELMFAYQIGVKPVAKGWEAATADLRVLATNATTPQQAVARGFVAYFNGATTWLPSRFGR